MTRNYAFFILVLTLISCNKKVQLSIPDDSYAVTETIFDTTITDRFRGIENIKDTTNLNWLNTYSTKTANFLKKLPLRDSIKNRIQLLNSRTGDDFIGRHVFLNSDSLLLAYAGKEDAYSKLYLMSLNNNSRELIYDPGDYKKNNGSGYYIRYIKPSWDKKIVAIEMLDDEISLFGEILFINMETKEVMPYSIPNIMPHGMGGLSWLPDSSGVIYTHFPETNPKKEGYYQNANSTIYFLEDYEQEHRPIFGIKTHKKELGFSAVDMPVVKINSQNDAYAIGYFKTTESHYNAYYTPIEELKKNNKPIWKPLFSNEDKNYGYRNYFKDNKLYSLTARYNNNYGIVSANIKTGEEEVVFEGFDDRVITDFELTSNGIVLTASKNGIEATLHRLTDNGLEDIELPLNAGSLSMSNFQNTSSFVKLTASGWIKDDVVLMYDVNKNIITELPFFETIAYPEFSDFVVETTEVPSHDGEMVPLSIIYKKGLDKSKRNPTLLTAYGAYGDNMSPFFDIPQLTFIEFGGVLAVAHVRGGSEKGANWYLDGKGKNKPNGWKDFNACAEYLISNKYCSNNSLIAWGESIAGIIFGMAIVEKPDLYKAVITQYGMMNPTRQEFSADGGSGNIEELGSIKSIDTYKQLIAMDPYLNLQDGTNYPDHLITGGLKDTRVEPWFVAKYAFRLMEVSNNNRKTTEVLLNINPNREHGAATWADYYEDCADIFAYAFWKTKQ